MNLRETLPDVIMESSRDVHPSSPKLDVANRLIRVICIADMEADEVVEFVALIRV